MIVTIHQPNVFPWLGFFDKMAQADLFILLDTVPFTKGGFQNRVQVKGPNGVQWLTFPVVTAGRLGQSTLDVEVRADHAWKRNHLGTFVTLYQNAPGYPVIREEIEVLYARDYRRLVDFTIPGIELIRDALGITTPLVRASSLQVSGTSSQLLCELVKAVGGTTYLSGPSGREYLDEEFFRANDIGVRYHSFRPFAYPQRFGDFVGGMSALDYLVNDPELSAWRSHACVFGS